MFRKSSIKLSLSPSHGFPKTLFKKLPIKLSQRSPSHSFPNTPLGLCLQFAYTFVTYLSPPEEKHPFMFHVKFIPFISVGT